MVLALGQVSVGDLVMGEGTAYRMLTGFDPWSRHVRADQGGDRAWGHGSWSGAEWTEQVVVPMRIMPSGSGLAGWAEAHRQLLAAFAPRSEDIELRWNLDGTEYMMRGRPRMVEPEVRTIGLGYAVTRAAFVALDPTIYSAVEHTEMLMLPLVTGGLTFPLTFPVTFPATVVSGRRTLVNAGTKTVGLRLRINGPVPEPRVALLTPDGKTATLRFWLTLESGQWLDVDTGARTVYLQGTASRRGKVTADDGIWPVLPNGSSEIAFDATVYDAAASMQVFWRDGWH